MAEEHQADDIFNEMEDGYNVIDEDGDNMDRYEPVLNTSAANVRQGRDIQGIRWDRFDTTREQYRLIRLQQYTNYENVENSGDAVKECKPTDKSAKYYEFFFNTRSVKPSVLHFQLRNLVWATSKHDVYVLSNHRAIHWSSTTRNLSAVLDFSGHIAPSEKHNGSMLEGFTHTQICTLAVKDNFMVAGGVLGELVCKRLDKQGVCFCTRTSHDENPIINSVEIYDSFSGGHHFMATNNDCGIRDYDMERFQLLSHFCFPWPVNHTSISPDRNLLLVVGDHPDASLVDSQSGQVVATTTGPETTLLQQHGTQTVASLPQATKTRHAGCGTFETYQNQYTS